MEYCSEQNLYDVLTICLLVRSKYLFKVEQNIILTDWFSEVVSCQRRTSQRANDSEKIFSMHGARILKFIQKRMSAQGQI